jgi:hypothetical protein
MANTIYVSPKQYNHQKHTLDDMRREVMTRIKHGQAITTKAGERVYVTAFYPNHILCHGATGATCYTYYQLWVMLQHKADKINIPEKLKRR